MMNEQNAAEVLEQDGPEKLPVVAEPDGGETDPNEAEGEHKKRLGGWQRKIQKLEREKETLIEALRNGGGNAKPEQTREADADNKPPVKPVRPKMSDFHDKPLGDYEAALEKYEADKDAYHDAKLKHELRQAESERQARSEQQNLADGFATQVAEAREEFKDFDSVAFNEDIPMSKPMQDAIVTSDYGALIAYELGKDPDLAERISQMSPFAAVRAIGKIESRIEARLGDKEKAAEKTSETPVATTRAPRPPSTVRRTAASNSEPDDGDDYKTWLKKREAQLRAR